MFAGLAAEDPGRWMANVRGRLIEEGRVSQPVELALLSVAWIAWGGLHSALITPRVSGWVRARWGRWAPCYRLFFNTISVVTIVPVLIFEMSLRTEPLLAWSGPLRIAQVAVWVACAVLLILGARVYDVWDFLGFRQIANIMAEPLEPEERELVTTGVLGFVRHPWYMATIMLLWSQDQDPACLVSNVILTAYIVAGTFLEERKLVVEFGDQYHEYQRNVSMLFPWKWLKHRLGHQPDQAGNLD